jgi:hypothetical protein
VDQNPCRRNKNKEQKTDRKNPSSDAAFGDA